MELHLSTSIPFITCFWKIFSISTETFHHLIESSDSIDSSTETIVREIEAFCIFILKSHESKSSTDEFFIYWLYFFDDISQCIEVIRTFCHFLIIHEKMSSMKPIFCELLSCEGFRLCYLILMMRKYQIDSPHMDIDLIPEKVTITSTTFDMPPWSSFDILLFTIESDSDRPLVLTIRFSIVCLPEGEVSYLLFIIFIIIDPDTRDHPLEVEVREMPVLFELRYTIIYRSVFCEVGISLLQESIDDLAHILYELRDRLDIISRDDPELTTIFEECFCIEYGEFFQALSRFLTISYRLIIDICDTHSRLRLISEESHTSNDEVIHEVVAEIADMCVVIRRRSTVVDLHFILFEWLEWFKCTRESIIDVETHKKEVKQLTKITL